MASSAAATYPVRLEVDAAAPQSRLTVFFRLFMMIPHFIVLSLLGTVVQIISFVAWLIILFSGTYPDGLLRFSIGVARWNARANAYYGLLTDVYPPFSMDEDATYPIRLFVDEQISGRNRLTTFFRLIMVIPQVIVLYLVQLAASVVIFIAWLIALFTGTVPDGLHNFIAGYNRWNVRVMAYALLLVDDYPPFSLD